jgi:putative PIN family toxin of toxin-antitoxin system
VISAVLDANTLVSAILVELGISRQILRAAYERRFICLCSAAIVAEVLRAFNRPRVRPRYTIDPNEVEELRRFLESELVAVAITVNVHGVATHPEDDLILATAVSANADYLVTGNRQLQALGSFQGVSIVSPREFLTLLQASATG